VGCMGRRSPGRMGGRGAPIGGAAGRGRWKMGWPGTGRPGAGRATPGAPACAIGAAGRGGGALYTGRGPVCGTIMRGAGGPGVAGGMGTPGRGATGDVDAEIGVVAGAWDDATTLAGGAATGRTGALIGGAGVSTAGRSAAGATTTGRAAGRTTAAGGTTGFATGGATTGLATTGRAAGLAGGATTSFCCVIALRTSPGREMCDRSILVLISSSPRRGRAVLAAAVDAPEEPRICARTFSASCSSRELECVFFSVTPTSVSVSRIALLFTSSSLARSLIRTLLIRPFCTPRFA